MSVAARKAWYLTAVALLCLAPCALAQNASITLTGAGSNVMAGVYVGPYTATINGVSTQVICDDFADNTYINESWTASVANFSNLGNTRNTTRPNPDLTPEQQALYYTQVAWLTLQMLSSNDPTTIARIHFAIWGIFDPSALTYLDPVNRAGAQGWIDLARAQHLTLDQFPNFLVYSPYPDYGNPTCNGGTCLSKPPQEFLVVTPEPSALMLLGVDLFALVVLILLLRRRLVQAAS